MPIDKVALVILNYNGRNFLEKFLPSVVKYTESAAIYVADSASTDGSVGWVEQNFPAVKTVILPKNYGYAGGYNRALKNISAEYYILLNSDVEVTPHWLTPIVNLLDQNPQIAACQPKLLAHHDKTQFEYAGAAGGYIDWLGYTYCRGRIFYHNETDTGQYDTTVPIFWASGAALAIRSKLFHEMGGFDEDFFAHMEEIDLCWRLHSAGYHVYCCPQSVVYHVGGGTLPPTSPFKTFLNYRNSLAMLYKNLPANRTWLILFLRLILDGISSIRYLPHGQWRDIWAIVRAHFAFYRWILGELPQKRRRIQQKIAQTKGHQTLPISSKSIIWAYFVKGCKTFDSFSRL
ncbi:glycosyltransferase [Runella sp. CRIBMP]|uniref:glycosyltransferase family 2 protein n=1 Tax=Runella sp. CRIBMP TaxID=2683261 RepID=UPI001412BAC5|nr:glycosyltransferase family 2 protein [Runella sp. CRIBMP]NBB18231.1 glycosyltransferase [Runella sp. CRIBMP]